MRCTTRDTFAALRDRLAHLFNPGLIALMALSALAASPAAAQSDMAPTTSASHEAQAAAALRSAAQARCSALLSQDFSQVLDAPTQLRSATLSKLDEQAPEVCRVDGQVKGFTGFALLLPANWSGKYVQGGCGGACGITIPYWCHDPIRRGHACLGTDMGHTSTTSDWLWARDNLDAKADFGFRSTHLARVAGQAIAELYYGRKLSYAYFMGCSTGGRQAHAEAQRYPADFHGIVAGAPPLNETATGLQLAWTSLANVDAKGQFIIREPQARLIHAAVVEACDMNDGLKDGLIGDPRQCGFKVASLQCRASASANSGQCLSAEQVAAAQKMYGGMVDRQGRPIGVQGGVMLGSELNWIGDYLPRGERAPQYLPFLASFFRHTAFEPSPPMDWALKNLDFERDWHRMGSNEFLYTANNPDLREFKRAGGKMIMFQGWGDTSVVPMGTIDYYDTVTRVMGGLPQTQAFYRLFMVPGMRHCSSDSVGGDTIDYLTALENWVEKGQAPDALIGRNYDWRGPITRTPIFPLESDRVRLTRPHPMYPAHARYKGHGLPDEASSWEAVLAP